MEIGFNTNLLETNIINLAVVVGVLIYFGGGILNTTLQNRQQQLQLSLEAADRQEQETQKKLEELRRNQNESVQEWSSVTQPRLSQALEEKRRLLFNKHSSEIQRLRFMQNESIRFAEEKCIQELSQEVKNQTIFESRRMLTTIFEPSRNRTVEMAASTEMIISCFND